MGATDNHRRTHDHPEEPQTMNLTPDFVEEVRKTARAYDGATTPDERRAQGARLDALADQLSEGQLKQVAKMIMR